MPGKIIQCLKKVKTENPLVLIDEVRGDEIKFEFFNYKSSIKILKSKEPPQFFPVGNRFL